MKRPALIFILLSLLAVSLAVYHASLLAYVNDDCFISFRYAQNLVNGLGLVYNAVERVEGYTNFLWTIFIAAALKLQLDPVRWTMATGIFCYAATICIYAFLSWKTRHTGRAQAILIPLTALALSVHRDMSAHATSGMETSMYSLLISATYATMILYRSDRALLGAGVLLVLAMMTRPDGVLFLTGSSIFLMFTRKPFFRSVIVLLIPSAVLFLPYWLWRWSYFGFFFPNSFYAKSIVLEYYSQGLQYTLLYLRTYPILLSLIPLGAMAAWGWRRTIKAGNFRKAVGAALRSESSHPLLLSALFIAIYGIFIIRIGGDFMFARFFIAITPVAYFAIEDLIRRLSGKSAYLSLCAIVVLLTMFRNDQYRNNVFVGYVADEAQYFKLVEPLEQAKRQAATLKKYVAGLPLRVAFDAGQVRLIYYLEPDLAIESSAGLTDTAIAHQQLRERGRPGHEKHPTMEYLVRRKTHFYLGTTDPPPPGTLVLNAIAFDSLRARIVTYDNSIMSKLREYPEVRFVDLPGYLDNYISDMPSYPREKVTYDYRFLKSFYFDVNSDSVRERVFTEFLHVQ